jgi:hypothetical protein
VRLEPRGHRCATTSLTGKCASTPFCNLKARRFIAGLGGTCHRARARATRRLIRPIGSNQITSPRPIVRLVCRKRCDNPRLDWTVACACRR